MTSGASTQPVSGARTVDTAGAVVDEPLFGAALFATMGWTAKQWNDTYAFFLDSAEPGADQMVGWLRNPREGIGMSGWERHPPKNVSARFGTGPLTPAVVLDVFTRHGEHAAKVLTAITVGASERFTLTFQAHQGQRSNYYSSAAASGWRFAARLGLTEPQATGWAATGYLHSRHDQRVMHGMPTLSVTERTALINGWVAQRGPDAWLWVLAGFDSLEAAAQQKTGTVITEQQLRVMVALNGVILPPGI